MANILDELTENLSSALKRIEALEAGKLSVPDRLSFPDFCKRAEITRPTAYAWAAKKLIQVEKIGGRNFVLVHSISVNSKKYFRKELGA